MSEYVVQVCGDGTSGWFELTVGREIDRWCTGKIGVAFTAERLSAVLEQIPGLGGQVTVTSDESEKRIGPKAWTVQLPDGAGPLWVDDRHSAGGSGLTGMYSPTVIVKSGAGMAERSKASRTGAKRLPGSHTSWSRNSRGVAQNLVAPFPHWQSGEWVCGVPECQTPVGRKGDWCEPHNAMMRLPDGGGHE